MLGASGKSSVESTRGELGRPDCSGLVLDRIGPLGTRNRNLPAQHSTALVRWIKLRARRADHLALRNPSSLQCANGLAHSNGPGGISTDGVRSVL
jgi:hypothetical protein